MDKNFWHQKWEKNEIGFHAGEANPFLMKYFDRLSLPQGARVFLPLCGKTLDIHWLISKGYRVAGAELSQKAIEQLFRELRVEPKITDLGELKRYSAKGLDIFVGDIFALTQQVLGPVDAIYDRAALVALPPEMRSHYTVHLRVITDNAPQLLICYEYDQRLTAGPPFSISDAEVGEHYQKNYSLARLESATVAGGLRGNLPAKENTWLLTKP